MDTDDPYNLPSARRGDTVPTTSCKSVIVMPLMSDQHSRQQPFSAIIQPFLLPLSSTQSPLQLL